MRRPVPDDLFPDGTEIIVCDILDARELGHACSGADTLVHLAALLHITNPPPELAPEYRRVNVEGTRAVAEAAKAAGVRRVVLFSTIAVYGYESGVVLDESSHPVPSTYYGKTKLEAENVLRQVVGSDGLPDYVILRFAAVYGARVKGNYQRLIRALDRGYFVTVSGGSNQRTMIYERDAARAAVLAATHPDAAGRTFNVTDGDFHAVSEIIAAISKALEKSPTIIRVPLFIAHSAAFMMEIAFGLMRREPPVTRETVAKLTEEVRVDGSKMAHALGFRPSCTFEQGWSQAIDQMRRRGDL